MRMTNDQENISVRSVKKKYGMRQLIKMFQ